MPRASDSDVSISSQSSFQGKGNSRKPSALAVATRKGKQPKDEIQELLHSDPPLPLSFSQILAATILGVQDPGRGMKIHGEGGREIVAARIWSSKREGLGK